MLHFNPNELISITYPYVYQDNVFDKKELKQDLAKFLSQVDAIPTIPHKKNNKYFIHNYIYTNS